MSTLPFVRPHAAPTVARTTQELAESRERLTGRVAVVMTMGALHEGHAALIRMARAAGDAVVVTIFVNPLQFGRDEDLDRYPRTLHSDLELCAREGVALVYVPEADDVYPDRAGGEGGRVTVDPGPLGSDLEGASRPGHFRGVLTVVAKLLHRVRPDIAIFGEKDYQQLVLIQRMVSDLDLPVSVVAAPIVREPDGLAMSSRNAYLTEHQRDVARAVPAALNAGSRAAAAGPSAVVETTRGRLAEAPGLSVDYVALRTPDLDREPTTGSGRLLVAVTVGSTRLIDNVHIDLDQTDPDHPATVER